MTRPNMSINLSRMDFYNKQMIANLLNIDMSFVREIGKNPHTEAVIHSIIDMTHRLNALTVAEGVETREQFEYLRDNGCDYIQEYYFSKPVSTEALINSCISCNKVV